MEQRKRKLHRNQLYFIIFQICATVFIGEKIIGIWHKQMKLIPMDWQREKEGAQTVLAIMHLKSSFLDTIVKIMSKLVSRILS